MPTADISVLVVDDSATFRSALAELLELAEGYRLVAQAGSGEESLQLCRELTPELVLMDLQLPGVDGLTAAQQVLEIVPPPVVVIISTDLGSLDGAAVSDSGALVARSKADLSLEWLADLRGRLRAQQR